MALKRLPSYRIKWLDLHQDLRWRWLAISNYQVPVKRPRAYPILPCHGKILQLRDFMHRLLGTGLPAFSKVFLVVRSGVVGSKLASSSLGGEIKEDGRCRRRG